MYCIEAMNDNETFIEVFDDLEEAIEDLKELISEGYDAILTFP